MSSYGAAPALLNTRAQASRLNGAKSRGPKTPQGKARSAQNALKHGLRAQKHVVLPDEDVAAFRALEAALIEELAPQGALQHLLASRIARAAWRLERAERIEGELFEHQAGAGDLGRALIRDGHGSRAFNTLLRYRGSALAELWRALRALKALQAEAAAREAPGPAPVRGADTDRVALGNPNGPKARRNPDQSAPSSAADEPEPPSGPDAGRALRGEPSAPAQAARSQDRCSDGEVRRPGRASEYRPDEGRSPPDRDRCTP